MAGKDRNEECCELVGELLEEHATNTHIILSAKIRIYIEEG